MFCHSCSVTKPCLTLWDPVDCSMPGSSVHGILQTEILEWGAVPFSTTQCEYHYFKCEVSYKHGSSCSSPPPANQLQAQILFSLGWVPCCMSVSGLQTVTCLCFSLLLSLDPPPSVSSCLNCLCLYCLSICSCFSEYLHLCLSLS